MSAANTENPVLDLTTLDLSSARLFDELPCWVSIQDRDFRIIKASAKLIADFGDHQGEKCYAAYKHRTEPCSECVVMRTFEDAKEHSSQEVRFDKRGIPHDVLVKTKPLRNRSGAIVAVVKMFVDTSSEVELTKRLHESVVRFRNLFDNAPCFISVQDRNFRITESNRRFDESFGDGMGEHCYELYKKRPDRCPRCPVAETFQDGQVHTSEEIVVDNQGRQIHTLVYTAPLLDASGGITSVMEMSADVTEVRTLQNELASVGQLVGGIAHDAKNILEGLRGGVYIVNLGFRNNNRQDINTGWDMVQRNVGRLSSMIMDMLYCAKKRSPRHVPVSLPAIAKEVIGLFRGKAEQFHIQLELKAEDRVEVLGESKEIHGLISNLITNAIEACNADQDEQKAHRIQARVFQDHGEAIIEIEDDGAGMDAATRNALFKDLVSTKGSAGTGLGLLTSKKVAAEHGGTIMVRSEPGKGSVFTVKLPIRLPNAARVEQS
jgi:PAS domain S-box-containing protein